MFCLEAWGVACDPFCCADRAGEGTCCELRAERCGVADPEFLCERREAGDDIFSEYLNVALEMAEWKLSKVANERERAGTRLNASRVKWFLAHRGGQVSATRLHNVSKRA